MDLYARDRGPLRAPPLTSAQPASSVRRYIRDQPSSAWTTIKVTTTCGLLIYLCEVCFQNRSSCFGRDVGSYRALDYALTKHFNHVTIAVVNIF